MTQTLGEIGQLKQAIDTNDVERVKTGRTYIREATGR